MVGRSGEVLFGRMAKRGAEERASAGARDAPLWAKPHGSATSVLPIMVFTMDKMVARLPWLLPARETTYSEDGSTWGGGRKEGEAMRLGGPLEVESPLEAVDAPLKLSCRLAMFSSRP